MQLYSLLIKFVKDKTSLLVSVHTPSSTSIRPDMVFTAKLSNGDIYEIGNGEVKAPYVSKSIVNATRVRVLETAKRQLHKRMRMSSACNILVTFGILIHGFAFELYVIRHVNGYYPYEKISCCVWKKDKAHLLPKDKTKSSDFVEYVYKPDLLKFMNSREDAIFMEDKAPIYTAGAAAN